MVAAPQTTKDDVVSASPDRTPVRTVPLPVGTVTFAFTDIEGSTIRWERDRAAMQEALRRHDDIVRSSVGANGGHVFKTIGDAFCSVFPRAETAVAAMLAVQREIAGQDFAAVGGLQVRAALHTGTADERDGDYFGPAVNRVARLLAIAHGGQVLVSGITGDLLEGLLTEETALYDLGRHRLKDLTQPERIYQLTAPGLARQFPALRSLDATPNNLPLQLTSFVGREAEVAEISALIARHRLVTIVGSGGVGKTRTAVQIGAHLLDGSGDGVWFIELAPLATGEYLPFTVAQAMGIVLPGDGRPLDLLVAALRPKRALLIFDNCEHIVDAAAAAIAAILRACPRIGIVATSRQALGIAGESAYRMPSLAVPLARAGAASAAETARYPAVGLFVDRALSVDNRFALSDDNVAVVTEICRRLDGIPLAIELAAARVKVLSPRQLRERLDERFRVLTGGSRDVLPRQQTLRALIDWSHELLDERERTLFRRLAIFVNGFTIESATAVCSGPGLDEDEAFDSLASLVDKSLVLAEPDGDGLRYRMLESTHAFACERLEAAGEKLWCAGRHVRYLRDLFVAARTRLERSGRWSELERLLLVELENARVALDRAVESDDVVPGSELLAAIGTGWSEIGLGADVLARFERFIPLLPEGASRLKAQLWTTVAAISFSSGQTRAFEAASNGVALARYAGDGEVLANALCMYAHVLARARNYAPAAAALAEAEACAPPDGVALQLSILRAKAFLFYMSDRFDAAAAAYERIRKTNLQLGNIPAANRAAVNLADTAHCHGRTAEAVAIGAEALRELRHGSNRSLLLMLLANLAGYFVALDRLAEARDAALEVLREAHVEGPAGFSVTIAIEHLALVIALESDLARSAQLAGYTEIAFARVGIEREFTERTTRTRLETLLQDRLDQATRGRLLAEGEALSAQEAIDLARAHSERPAERGS
jgi:predicted ATPase/class 3 adenylate cyclase